MRQALSAHRLTEGMIAVALAIGMALVLAACGGDEPTVAPTATTPVQQQPTAAPTQPSGGATPTPRPTQAPSGGQPTPAKAAWEAEWDALVEAAKKEGKLVVTVFRADDRASAEKFEQVVPGLDVEVVVLAGRDAGTKIPAERKAGLYQYDVWLSGGTTMISTMIPLQKKSGDIMFDNMRAMLFRPDVVEDKNWIGYFDDHWIDDQDDKNILFKMYADPTAAGIYINTQKIDPSQLRRPADLFKLALKGRWCADDPRSPGSGATFFTNLMVTEGADFVRRLFEETDLRIGTDGRAMAQDLIRGDMLACVGPEIGPFHEQGVGLHVKSYQLQLSGIAPEYEGKIIANCCGEGKKAKEISGFYSSSISGPAVFTKAPHPKAAQLFVNWLLTHEGQVAWNEPLFTTCSSREDMKEFCANPPPPNLPPPFLLEDGKAYITFHSQTNVPYRQAAQDIARKVYGR